MKIAILSDIHGNVPALEAVTAHVQQWQPDEIVVAGDIVNRGPLSLACWQFVAERAAVDGWQVMRGNHEGYILHRDNPDDLREGPLFEMTQLSYWTYLQLDTAVPLLADLPETITLFAPDGQEVRVRHASMHHDRDGLFPEADESTLAAQIAPAPAVFGTAHIHRPFIRQVNGTLVVNAGSVGSPADKDRRASYTQIVWDEGAWQAEIIRVPYDMERAGQDYFSSGMMAETGPFSWLIYYEWLSADFVLPEWVATYWQPVLNRKISLETAVNRYLTNMGLSE